MSDDEALAAVVAHGLLNSTCSIGALVSIARTLVATDNPDRDRIDRLLRDAEQRAHRISCDLLRLARGLPVDDSARPDDHDSMPDLGTTPVGR